MPPETRGQGHDRRRRTRGSSHELFIRQNGARLQLICTCGEPISRREEHAYKISVIVAILMRTAHGNA